MENKEDMMRLTPREVLQLEAALRGCSCYCAGCNPVSSRPPVHCHNRASGCGE